MYTNTRKATRAFLRPLSTLLLGLLVLQGCNALNPLCGSARPAPFAGSLSASTITFAEVQEGFLLTVNGSQFVSSSVVVINGTTLSTKITSSQQLQVTITTALISGPGTASVIVNTPSGNSGDLGCTSGGTSRALVLTIT
jgi:trimeric autotransporter adhesin